MSCVLVIPVAYCYYYLLIIRVYKDVLFVFYIVTKSWLVSTDTKMKINKYKINLKKTKFFIVKNILIENHY